MCLVKVKQEEDVVVPYRVVQKRASSPHRRASRVSHTHLAVTESSTSRQQQRLYQGQRAPSHSHTYSQTHVVVPAPQPSLAIPAPQARPVFVEPPPAPIHLAAPVHHEPRTQIHEPRAQVHEPLYVRVSPRSSMGSMPSRDEYMYRETEIHRQRGYSPARSSYGGDHHDYRYIDPPSHREDPRFLQRDRSMSRGDRSMSRGRPHSYADEPRRSTSTYRQERYVYEDDHQRRREYNY